MTKGATVILSDAKDLGSFFACVRHDNQVCRTGDTEGKPSDEP